MEEGGEDGKKLKEELRACQDLLLNVEIEKGRQKVSTFKYQFYKKLEEIFNKLGSAAKINLAFGFVFSNVEREKINTTTLTKTKHYLKNSTVFKSRFDYNPGNSRKFFHHEAMHSRTSEHKAEVQVDNKCHYFCFTTKNVPMGCLDSDLSEPLLKNLSVSFLLSDKKKQPHKNHLCLFRGESIYPWRVKKHAPPTCKQPTVCSLC